jgi:hypothetical protein
MHTRSHGCQPQPSRYVVALIVRRPVGQKSAGGGASLRALVGRSVAAGGARCGWVWALGFLFGFFFLFGGFVMRQFVFSRSGRLPWCAAWWRSVVGASLAAGACRWRLRRSARAFSGAVVVVGFPCLGRARRFAAAWSGWCGVACSLSPRVCPRAGRVWVVSVPVCPPRRVSAPAVAPDSGGRVFWVGAGAAVAAPAPLGSLAWAL